MSTFPARAAFAAALALTAIAFNPGPARADDAARIRNLESEIQRLRTQLDEQDRRIQRLEAELERRGGMAPPDWRTAPPAARATTRSGQAAGPLARHSSEAWDRIAKGMTQEEVVKILGEPASVEATGNLKSLFYREAAADGGSVNGHVNLKDDRVVAIKKPVARE